jgi:hypothetical protein
MEPAIDPTFSHAPTAKNATHMISFWSRTQPDSSDAPSRDHSSLLTDLPFFLAILAVFAVVIGAYHYRGEFSEDDSYGVLVGLLNGRATGRWSADPAQYGIRFGYGYVSMIYWLADMHAFTITRENLIEVINDIGFVAAMVSAALCMATLRIMYGTAVALIATTLLIFSPAFLEMATSGHQLLVALAFFLAANLLLVLEIEGRAAITAHAAAILLLFIGLTIRAELPLAFPWLILARSPHLNKTAWSCISAIMTRCIVCVLAFALFLIVLHYRVQSPVNANTNASAMNGISTFIGAFYKLSSIPRGFVILAVGCGLVTVFLGLVSLAARAAELARDSHWLKTLLFGANLLAPVSLIVFGVVFWIPNPTPARHFTFVLLGLAVLAAIGTARTFRPGNLGALAAGIAIVLANQAVAEAVRPIILGHLHSQYLQFPERDRITGAAPVGSFTRHHMGLVERREVLTNLGRAIAASHEPRLLVVSSYLFQFESLLFVPGADTRITERISIGPFNGIKLVRSGQSFVFVDPFLIWPRDPIAIILADPRLNEYRIFQDPYSLSAADKTPVPADRVAVLPSH